PPSSPLFPYTTLSDLDVATDDQFYYRQTAAEIAAGVTPTDYSYQPGDVRRYGATSNNSTDCLAAFTSALAQHEQGGPPVKVVAEDRKSTRLNSSHVKI